MNSVRTSCFFCVEKHLSQATILLLEFQKDPESYNDHFDFALGHLGEAEDQSIAGNIDLSTSIREERIKMTNSYFENCVKFKDKKEIVKNMYFPELDILREGCKVLAIEQTKERMKEEEKERYPLLEYIEGINSFKEVKN